MCKAIEEMCEEISAKAREEGFQEGFQEGFREGFQEGFQEGCQEYREEQSIIIAREMLQSGKMTPVMAAKFTHLPLEKILTLC